MKQENDTRMAAAAADTDRLKQENDSRTAAAGAEADRLNFGADRYRIDGTTGCLANRRVRLDRGRTATSSSGIRRVIRARRRALGWTTGAVRPESGIVVAGACTSAAAGPESTASGAGPTRGWSLMRDSRAAHVECAASLAHISTGPSRTSHCPAARSSTSTTAVEPRWKTSDFVATFDAKRRIKGVVAVGTTPRRIFRRWPGASWRVPTSATASCGTSAAP